MNSLSDLVGAEVDTVSFVRDYVELRMDYSVLRLLVDPTGVVDGQSWSLTPSDGAEPLRRYIGRWVSGVEYVKDEHIALTIEDGASLGISLRPEDGIGPEAAHFVPAHADGTLNVAGMLVY